MLPSLEPAGGNGLTDERLLARRSTRCFRTMSGTTLVSTCTTARRSGGGCRCGAACASPWSRAFFFSPLASLADPQSGLYVPDDERWPKHFRGMGIRIEDSICVRDEGPLNLTVEAVKEVRCWMLAGNREELTLFRSQTSRRGGWRSVRRMIPVESTLL
jgi:hypothetical protein